ncbi:DUF2163 domain-containing protein [Zavarzinia sp. CC-PAN008]|uniref:DUF2163 domain-containing protein n=1 Tax=Zavarzinia sp. CC-PAN008 TaxID=3243332 RepID=UPI003F743B9F
MSALRIGRAAALAPAAAGTRAVHASRIACLVLAERQAPLRLGRVAVLLPALSTPCVTRHALVWTIRRRDGTAHAFTTHDRALSFQGLVARACDGFAPSASEARSDGSAGTMDLVGVLNDEIAEADLLSGALDDADIECWQVDWDDRGTTPRLLQKGRIGQVEHSAAGFRLEVRTLAALLNQPVGEVYTAQCRWTLGDARCGVAVTVRSGTVTAVDGLGAFRDDGLSDPDGTFDHGRLSWTTGANAGLAGAVKRWTLADHRLVLHQPAARAVAPGDTFDVAFGCPRTADACANRFANLLNFGGFPHVPGHDALQQRPPAR